MHKKITATLLALSMLITTGVAYGNTEVENNDSEIKIEEGIGDITQGVPGGSGEDLGVRVVSQDSEDLGGVPGDSRGDLDEVEIRVQKIEITEGSIIFGDNSFNISNSKSVDFLGTFNVDAAAGDVSGAPVRLTNTGETELIVYAEKCKSIDSTSPSIVAPSTYSDWTSLSQEETVNNMALGFKVDEDGIFWFDDESSQQAEKVCRLQPGETITLQIIGKCGTQWPQSCTINYDCTLGFEVVPIEKEIEVIGNTEAQEGQDQSQSQEDQQQVENTLETVLEDNSEQSTVINISEEKEETQVKDQLSNEEQNNNQDQDQEEQEEINIKESQEEIENIEIEVDADTEDIQNINTSINTESDTLQ